jgi:hypothetical protein
MKTPPYLGVAILALHVSTVLLQSQEMFLPLSKDEGKTEDNPFVLKLNAGEKLLLPATLNAPCFVTFEVHFPLVLVLELQGIAVDSAGLELKTYGTKPLLTMPVIRKDSGGVIQLTYALTPRDYRLTLRGIATENKPQVTRPYLRVVGVDYTSELFPFVTGERASLRLDQISRSASRKFQVARRSLVTFSIDGAPKPGEWEKRMSVVVRTPDGVEVIPVESSESKDGKPHASFILRPGDYYVQADASYNGWPQPLLEKRMQVAEITLRIEELIEQEIPPSMVILEQWLRETGLFELIEVSELVDLRDPRRSLPRGNKRFASEVTEVVFERTRLGSGTSGVFTALQREIAKGGEIDWPASLKEKDRPCLVVSLRAKQDRDVFEATERGFELKYKVGLWYRVLDKVSAVEAVSANQIVVFVPVWCDQQLVYLTRDRSASRHGSVCLSASASKPLITASNVAAASVHNIMASKLPSLAESVPAFLESFMRPAKPLQLLSTEADFVEVIVRGLRGQVIRDGPDWEKLKCTFALTPGEKDRPSMLRVILDGQIASGLGDYPQDSAFTRDMEPEFYKSLAEYTSGLADSLSKHLVKSGERK